ncbi:nucleotidyltransferase family protein [Aliikangiella sp. G2MR2-5]|uniref:nucleotidyltransferase family protein n=1 Tax=Aliikangiella sp. G2MR2-5 TaxID=2788943 RepID=UPI0018A8E71A|nr:nucleotidyltransferase family protein [Aliikangiella sp. G2MR2-5]
MFEAVVLAGGKGKRLKSITGDTPKPMVNINGTPFLYLLMRRLESFGCKKIILSLCYKADFIIERVNLDSPVKCEVSFSVEQKPLGTGGAIKQASKSVTSNNFLVLNGDTYLDIDYSSLIKQSKPLQNCICLVKVNETGRYGKVELDSDERIISFTEKSQNGPGLVNSGAYVLNTKLIQNIEKEAFSFENEVLSNTYKDFCVEKVDVSFIDIGIPEDYFKFCKLMRELEEK